MNQRIDRHSIFAEFLGSATLSAVVVGSGIAGESLSPHSPAVALLCNSLATAGALFVLILTLGPISGAQFNPIVTLVLRRRGPIKVRRFFLVISAQILGCVSGVIAANVTFSEPLVTLSTHSRATFAHLMAELVATAGLIFTIGTLSRIGRESSIPGAVACYIGVAYFACSSTSFANPAITFGRMLTDTFAGIAPGSVVPFIAAQCIGGLVGWSLIQLVVPVQEEY
jgi:arsenate reductase